MDENPYDSPVTDEHTQPSTSAAANQRSSTAFTVLVFLGILGLFLVLFMPPVRTARQAAARAQCTNNLKQIGIALHNYAQVHGALPPAYTVDASGNRLHSWRTLILPFMEGGRASDSIDLSKPWDDPANAEARKIVVPSYRCWPDRDGLEFTHTTYLAIVTPDSCLQANKGRSLEEITDGASSAMMIIEVDADHAVPWMSPNDAEEQVVLGLAAASRLSHSGGMNALFADGSVHFLPDDTPEDQLRALISIAGNDQDVLDDWE